jgi:hypothetical protein
VQDELPQNKVTLIAPMFSLVSSYPSMTAYNCLPCQAAQRSWPLVVDQQQIHQLG